VKPETRILSRSDISEENILTLVREGWLPIPESVIPPQRKNLLWDTLPLEAYHSNQDYLGKLLDNLRSAIRRTICEWDPVENIDRVGVWLSGGIDSSTLLYLTCQVLGPEKVRAYSVNFGDRNEVERAKLIADRCHVRLVMKEMTAEDSIHLTEETVLYLRGPVDTTHVVFASKLCSEDGTRKILSALGLDELQAGYPEHVNATREEFCEVEGSLLWKCQSSWAWAQQMGSPKYVDVKFPFLRRELVAWCRGLPRSLQPPLSEVCPPGLLVRSERPS
jgi:asparagine synthetase B (glutamine-hydrolysing)